MFRQLTDTLYVSPQISLADVAQAQAIGVVMVINNRPDDEEPGQVPGAQIEAAARAAGMEYVAVPVTHAGFAPWQLDQMTQALDKAGDGKVLAYCRSGTRSTLLWALSRAQAGQDSDRLAEQAAGAGYDLGPIRQMMDTLAGAAKG
jgi:uncharacterized protein (TIGR01244 family)